jgi:basic amino acid/polyamine antiporter, APA family
MNDNRSLRAGLFRRKPVSAFVVETGAATEGGELNRTIGLFSLTMFGVGATIGTGIVIVFNTAVPTAGPGVSGSSYSYTYATLGEFAHGVGRSHLAAVATDRASELLVKRSGEKT